MTSAINKCKIVSYYHAMGIIRYSSMDMKLNKVIAFCINNRSTSRRADDRWHITLLIIVTACRQAFRTMPVKHCACWIIWTFFLSLVKSWRCHLSSRIMAIFGVCCRVSDYRMILINNTLMFFLLTLIYLLIINSSCRPCADIVQLTCFYYIPDEDSH